MKNFIKFLSACAMLSAPAATYGQSYPIEKTTEIKVAKPAFLFNYKDSSTGMHDLYISTFQPFGADKVLKISNIDAGIQANTFEVNTVLPNVKWPNEIGQIPSEIFGDDYYTSAGGFLVPGKSDGAITVFHGNTSESFELTSVKKGYFYHRVVWHDVNSDGKLDIITARTNKPIFGASKGELLWLENPGVNHKTTWKEHMIAKGPDVHFRVADLDDDSIVEIIAAEFFSKKLSLIQRTGDTWIRTLLDDTLGSAFDLELKDINNDGKVDLLVTNHEPDEKAAVFTYEIPENLTDKWTRHTLFSGFVTLQKGINQASPGEAMAVHPDQSNKNMKPVILVSGDGSQNAHILVPASEDPNNWDYTEKSFLNAEATVGKMAVDDVNGDGLLEIFVPSYDKNTIHVFSFTK